MNGESFVTTGLKGSLTSKVGSLAGTQAVHRTVTTAALHGPKAVSTSAGIIKTAGSVGSTAGRVVASSGLGTGLGLGILGTVGLAVLFGAGAGYLVYRFIK